jgi:hypothetical protein
VRTFYVKITSGSSSSLFTVYYNITDSGHIALYDPALGTTFDSPAINLTYSQLTTGDGVLVSVPDTIESIILYDQNDFCAPIECITCDTSSLWTFDGTQYYRDIITSASPPILALEIYKPTITSTQYSADGTIIYDSLNVPILTLTTPNVWKNSVPDTNVNSGPLNRSGIWSNTTSGVIMTPIDTWVGFSVCLTGLTEGHQYYVGVGGDNGYSLWYDGTEIASEFNLNLVNFRKWHVFPIIATGGKHILELYGINKTYSTPGPNPARFGCEVYDNTLSELTAATSYANLNVLFSSDERVGAYFDIGKDLSGNQTIYGYTCPGGGIYSSCDGVCVEKVYCNNVVN